MTNNKYSWMYDPLVTMRVTIACQLRALRLIELLIQKNIKIVSANTDGVVIHTKKTNKTIVDNIIKQWEKETQSILEETKYKKLVMRDVNNYLAIKEDGSVKLKGAFEIDKELHKNHSMLIVPKALKEYFVNGTPIEETIKNGTDIYDYCIGIKNTSGYIQVNKVVEGKIYRETYKKNFRYYVSNKGGSLEEIYTKGKKKGSKSRLNFGYSITPFNIYFDSKNYDINYSFYIKECYKIIDIIENKQLELF